MAATKTSSNSIGSVPRAARDASETVATGARKARVPLLLAGGAAAGLAGGLALGGRRRRGLSAFVAPRRQVLGVPIGRKNGLVRTAEALGRVATATERVAETTGDLRRIREQLDKANRKSPVEVVVDALTHRRGAHEPEGG